MVVERHNSFFPHSYRSYGSSPAEQGNNFFFPVFLWPPKALWFSVPPQGFEFHSMTYCTSEPVGPQLQNAKTHCELEVRVAKFHCKGPRNSVTSAWGGHPDTQAAALAAS